MMATDMAAPRMPWPMAAPAARGFSGSAGQPSTLLSRITEATSTVTREKPYMGV